MNDDDDSSGEFFFDLLKTLVAVFVLVLFVALMGGIFWGFIAWSTPFTYQCSLSA